MSSNTLEFIQTHKEHEIFFAEPDLIIAFPEGAQVNCSQSDEGLQDLLDLIDEGYCDCEMGGA
jgi:hypothetical protein